MSLKLLSTVGVVIGKTKAIEARCSRLGKPAFRVSFCKRLVRTVGTVASRKLVNNSYAACLDKACSKVRNVGFLAIDNSLCSNLIGTTA